MVEKVKLICGIIAADNDIADRATDELQKVFGEIDIQSECMAFDFTDYYFAEMGRSLVRKFVAFSQLVDPQILAEAKIKTNELEKTFAVEAEKGVWRKVNLDPGYIAPDKLVLASTKNFSHRICLSKGIYAEVTLNFGKKGCVFFNWTYPDFRSGKYTPFLLDVRRSLMDRTLALPFTRKWSRGNLTPPPAMRSLDT